MEVKKTTYKNVTAPPPSLGVYQEKTENNKAFLTV